MRLFKRGEIWFVAFYADGKRVKRTTHCSDRRAAQKLGEQWERDAADPAGATARGVTLQRALETFLAQRQELADAGQRSEDTVVFYRRKAGMLLEVFARVLEQPQAEVLLSRITAAVVDAYVTRRRASWADPARTRHVTDHTIKKELGTLQAALRLAKRRGLWSGDVEAVVPTAGEVAAKYRPRTRWLTPREIEVLVGLIAGRGAHARYRADRGARVAFAVATGAEWGALERAERADVRLGHEADLVLVRGTKRPSRWRTVPVLLPSSRALLRSAARAAQGEGARLFRPWANSNRDLKAWCRRARIDPCSWNDLRRSFAQWLRQGGVSNELVAPAMGHVDTSMVERVYGRLDPANLALRIAAQLSGTPVGQLPGTEAAQRDSVDDEDVATAANSMGT